MSSAIEVLNHYLKGGFVNETQLIESQREALLALEQKEKLKLMLKDEVEDCFKVLNDIGDNYSKGIKTKCVGRLKLAKELEKVLGGKQNE